jgi:hypothetical protein
MRINRILGALGVGVLISGCTMYENGARNLSFEAVLCVDRKAACVHYHRLADAAWAEVRHAHAEQYFSADYVRGFKRGYTEFLRTGAPAGPPPIPSRWYWKVCYETPAGHQAMEDWMAGFTQGVAAARASGERALVAVPTSVPPPGDRTVVPPGAVNQPTLDIMTPVELPAPRKEAPPPPEDKGPQPSAWKPKTSPFSPVP